MTIDISKVPKLEERKRAEALFKEVQAAQVALDAKEDERTDSDVIAGKYELMRVAERHNYYAKLSEINDLEAAERGTTAEAQALKVAKEAYEADDVAVLLTNYDDDENLYCALSGLPLLADDEVLSDEDTGELVLRCLVLAPRPAEDDEQEEAA